MQMDVARFVSLEGSKWASECDCAGWKLISQGKGTFLEEEGLNLGKQSHNCKAKCLQRQVLVPLCGFGLVGLGPLYHMELKVLATIS